MVFRPVPKSRAAAPRLDTTALRLDQVTKLYGSAGRTVAALDDVSLSIPRGTFTAVMGPSGSGKSTLLHCAAGLDRPTSGSVYLGGSGTDLTALSETKLTMLRRRRIGFVFQSFNLVAWLNVRQNITLPMRLAHHRVSRSELRDILELVGLTDRAGHLPSELSGGQQQRVAIARALIARPDVVFADEPTGALDTVVARQILGLLRQAVDRAGQTTVMVTHDPLAASYADAVVFLADGRVTDIATDLSASQIADRITRVGAWG